MNHTEALQIYDQIKQGQYKMLRKAFRDEIDDEVDYFYVAQLTVERNNYFFLRWLINNVGPMIVLGQIDELIQIAQKNSDSKNSGNKKIINFLKRQIPIKDRDELMQIYQNWLHDPFFSFS